MSHSAADLIRRIEDGFIAAGADLATLAASSGVPECSIVRILRLDYDPRIDEAMALARSIGMVILLAPLPFAGSSFSPVIRPRGAAVFAAQDLLRLRDGFQAYRRATGASPTRLAQLCGVNEKAFRRVENGSRIPTLGLATYCAKSLGLSIIAVAEAVLPEAAAALDAERWRHAGLLVAELERSLSPPADLPEIMHPLASTLSAHAERHGLGLRQISAATGIGQRTLTGAQRRSSFGGPRLNPIGLLPTTARIAAVLGYDLIIVPIAARWLVSYICDGATPLPNLADTRTLDGAVSNQISEMQARIRRACSDWVREGASTSDVGDILRLAKNLRHAHTARLASRLYDLDFILTAVPSEMATMVWRAAASVRPSPLRDTRKGPREATADRNRRLTACFIGRLEYACRARLHFCGLPKKRVPLQTVLERLDVADLALNVVDTTTKKTVLRYCGRDASELVGHIIELRIKRGYSLHSLGAGINLTHSAVRRAERPEARGKALLSSVLRYAEAIGLDLVPGHRKR